ncbi:hypothetical protein V492_01356 [Pseudogymnoascus sp. VKM F-4246]|nr:hypothetical protein V492_01356 [Pseudogymnoascus sp. VKM F-4246]
MNHRATNTPTNYLPVPTNQGQTRPSTAQTTTSIRLPMPRQTPIRILLPQIQLKRIQRHRRRDINPSPYIPRRIPPLQRPPRRRLPILRQRREVLHQQARVHRHQDRRAEPAEHAEEPARAIVVFERGFAGEAARARVPHGGDDARGGVEDEDAVGEGDDHRGRDGLEGGVEEGEA